MSNVAVMPRPRPIVLEPAAPSKGFWQQAWERLQRNRAAMIGLGIVVILILVALLAPVLAPYSYSKGNLLHTTEGPSAKYFLGTDEQGRDILSRLIYGARVSLGVAFAAQLVILLVGVPVGLATGYIGGWLDLILMRVVDAIYALPSFLLAILIMAMVRTNISATASSAPTVLNVLDTLTGGLIGVLIVLVLTRWLTVARLVRAEVLSVKQRDFVEAARSSGVPPFRLVVGHIMPHVLAPVIVSATFGVPGAIMLEAGLSFLGIGVNPPTPSWGLMISDGLANMQAHPHMLTSPALVLAATLLAFTFLGDGLRDAMDPLMKN
jgi:ABC-type dipeptide/oligopeptide/nickel transport system permease subunit